MKTKLIYCAALAGLMTVAVFTQSCDEDRNNNNNDRSTGTTYSTGSTNATDGNGTTNGEDLDNTTTGTTNSMDTAHRRK